MSLFSKNNIYLSPEEGLILAQCLTDSIRGIAEYMKTEKDMSREELLAMDKLVKHMSDIMDKICKATI
jgi:hypothetical protein